MDTRQLTLSSFVYFLRIYMSMKGSPIARTSALRQLKY